MTTENHNPEVLDAPKPDAVPPGFVDMTRIREVDLDYLDPASADQIRLAQAAARAEKRKTQAAATTKLKAESDASTARAKEVTDEVISREEQETPPEPGEELVIPDKLSSTQQQTAAVYAEDIAAIAADHGASTNEAQVILDTAVDIALTILASGESPDLANQEECRTLMVNRWGAEATKELIKDANKAVAALGPKVRAWLNTRNELDEAIGNSPATIYALAAWARGYTRMEPEQAHPRPRRPTPQARADPRVADAGEDGAGFARRPGARSSKAKLARSARTRATGTAPHPTTARCSRHGRDHGELHGVA